MPGKIKVGVVGSGTMGAGIAQVAAEAGHEVHLFDANPDALVKAESNLLRIMNRLVEKGRRTQDEADSVMGRISCDNSLTSMRDCGLIIEAIVENLEIKQSVFLDLESMVSENCILASNTSSLSIASIAGACKIPSRVVGTHFFNPAPLMKLVEIIPAIQTAEKTLSAAKELVDAWGKLTVVAKDTPGFIVNRVARPFYSEALRIYDEGLADIPTIDWAMTELGGFRMGPFTLMDYIGNDINYAVTESVWSACYFEPRYKPSFTQKRLVEAGYLGRKTGQGYYDYSENAELVTPNKNEELGKDILSRVVMMLMNEAAEALYWGVASRDDIDLAMTKGVNYPKGLLRWADELGIHWIVETLDRCFDEYREERYRCSSLLRSMARKGQHFYED
jgi:3-hydroxybutyryl-CoA dehydrogenase